MTTHQHPGSAYREGGSLASPRGRLAGVLALAREAPWLAGVAAGWFFLWLRGRAFVFGGPLLGFGWWDYLMVAWRLTHGVGDQQYSTWRNPLWPVLVGNLGEHLGYVVAALLLSSVATGLLVLAAGLAGRVLGSPWAGGLAALSIPFVRTTAEASRWLTLYPPLAATSGLVVAFGACFARWPRWWLALATGLALGLSWGLDWRGLFMALPGGLLFIIGLIRSRGGPRRILLLLSLVLGLSTGPASIKLLGGPAILTAGPQVYEQRQVVLRWIHTTHDPELNLACAGEPEREMPNLAALARPCARTLFSYNLGHDFRRELPFGLAPTLWLLPLVLLPGRRGWRGLATGGAAVLLPSLMLLGMGLWVLLPDRYVLQFAVITALVVPLAISRGLRTLLPRSLAPWLEALAMLGAAWWLVQVGPRERGRPTKMELNPDIQKMEQVLTTVRTELATEDRLLDCSATHLEVALLPQSLHAPPLVLKEPDQERCRAWAAQPEPGPGSAWLATDARWDPREQNERWALAARVNGAENDFLLWHLVPVEP